MSIWTALSDYVSGILQPAQWFVDWIGGAGEPGTRRVGPERALTYAAVYRAVSLISGQTATLPLHVYQRLSDTERVRARRRHAPAHGRPERRRP